MRIPVVFFILSFPAWAENLILEEFDQIKLGELVSKLPNSVANKERVVISETVPGYEESITFPVVPQGFQIMCKRKFYNESPFPSFTNCSVTIYPKHVNFIQSYDEIRFRVTDPNMVYTLFSAIPYGAPLKEFYSWERDAGVNYDGKKRDIFHYRFECSKDSCLIRFSGIKR